MHERFLFSFSNIAKSYFHLLTWPLLFYLKLLEAITVQTFTYAIKKTKLKNGTTTTKKAAHNIARTKNSKKCDTSSKASKVIWTEVPRLLTGFGSLE